MAVLVLAALWKPEQAAVRAGEIAAQLPVQWRARAQRGEGEHAVQRGAAYLLLRQGFWQLSGKQTILPDILERRGGKPFFAGESGLHFSLSHTAGLAVCAIGRCEMGIDAERLRPVPEERQRRLQLPGGAAAWTEWTARESRVKRRGGHGLLCRAPVSPEEDEWVQALPAARGYAVSLCTQGRRVAQLQVRALEEWMRP